MSPNLIIFMGVVVSVTGALISGFGVYLSGQQDTKAQRELKEKSEEITRLSKANASLIVKESIGAVTGGNSWFYLEPHIDQQGSKVLLSFRFIGKYPLMDTVMYIEKSHLNWSKKAYEKVSAPEKRVLHTLYPAMDPSSFETIKLPEVQDGQSGVQLFFATYSRNGKIEQEMFIRREGDYYSVAYKLIKYTPREEGSHISELIELKKHIDGGFPSHELPKAKSMGSWASDFSDK